MFNFDLDSPDPWKREAARLREENETKRRLRELKDQRDRAYEKKVAREKKVEREKKEENYFDFNQVKKSSKDQIKNDEESSEFFLLILVGIFVAGPALKFVKWCADKIENLINFIKSSPLFESPQLSFGTIGVTSIFFYGMNQFFKNIINFKFHKTAATICTLIAFSGVASLSSNYKENNKDKQSNETPKKQFQNINFKQKIQALTKDLNTESWSGLAKDRLKSAKRGQIFAIKDIAHFYATGTQGVNKDLNKAKQWASISAEMGHEPSIEFLNKLGVKIHSKQINKDNTKTEINNPKENQNVEYREHINYPGISVYYNYKGDTFVGKDTENYKGYFLASNKCKNNNLGIDCEEVNIAFSGKKACVVYSVFKLPDIATIFRKSIVYYGEDAEFQIKRGQDFRNHCDKGFYDYQSVEACRSTIAMVCNF